MQANTSTLKAMPLPVIADTLRATIRGTTPDSDQWVNVLHFRKTGALTYPAAIAILDPLLLAHYQTNAGAGQAWRTNAPTTAAIVDFAYTPLDGSTATTIIPHALAGVNAGAVLPGSVAYAITLRTGQRGRSFRGRCYWGPFTTNFVAATGRTSNTFATAVATQWNNFLTNLTGSGVSLVVASYSLALATDVASCSTDTRLDSQRRRLGRV